MKNNTNRSGENETKHSDWSTSQHNDIMIGQLECNPTVTWVLIGPSYITWEDVNWPIGREYTCYMSCDWFFKHLLCPLDICRWRQGSPRGQGQRTGWTRRTCPSSVPVSKALARLGFSIEKKLTILHTELRYQCQEVNQNLESQQ